MKILHISPYYLPDVQFGGPTFSVSALCEALAQKGIEITVFTIGYHKENTVENYPQEKRIKGVRIKYFYNNWGSPCQISYQLWNAVKSEAAAFDLIHINTWWNILIFRTIQLIRRQKVPTIISLRGMLGNYSFSHRKTFLKNLFQVAIGNKLLSYTTILATSELEADEISNRTGCSVSDIEVLPNLLGLMRMEKYQAPATGYKLGFLSRLHHKKGIEILLKAVAKSPEVDELIIGGSGDDTYEKHLRKLVAQLGIAGKVSFKGWITQEEKEAFFKKFHVFVLPSFHENFANVVAEAWAAGKPVIISNEVGLSEYVDKNNIGWVCGANVPSTVPAIKEAFQQKEKWPEMGVTALNMVANQLSDVQVVDRYIEWYKSSVNAAPKITNNSRKVVLQNNTYVLGINAFHADASASLFCNGKLIAAMEEERFKRIKHWAGFPMEAALFCIKEAGITAADITHVAVGRDPKAKRWQKARFALQNPDVLNFAMKGRLSNALSAVAVEQEIKKLGGRNQQVVYIEHHRCHLASAFYASPFSKAALISIDGSGDFSTIMLGIGSADGIKILQSVDFPHSLGIFYSAFTQLLGFPNYGDEYKVMGLAPFGQPIFANELRSIIRLEKNGGFQLAKEWFRPPSKGYIIYDENHQPRVPVLFSRKIEEKFGVARTSNQPITQTHKNLAASVQLVLEEAIFHILHHLHAITGLSNLCLAGGVAQNSVANGKIVRNTSFKKVFVPSAGHDAGLSVGAGMYLNHHLLKLPKTTPATAYTGISFTNNDILLALQKQNLQYKKADSFCKLCKDVVICIAEGGVVGWFRGRAEFGPRALGNRSILADPRRSDAKELLNKKIKYRESFRPFAPAILAEYAAEYFDETADAPFMEKVFPIKNEKQQLIPAVTHVDGTGRLQTVSRQSNSDFYELINTFRMHTGIPILLNTSFNENEPIVNTPTEALSCFLRTQMDMLIMEDYIITKQK